MYMARVLDLCLRRVAVTVQNRPRFKEAAKALRRQMTAAKRRITHDISHFKPQTFYHENLLHFRRHFICPPCCV